jgi:hypothetical protein
MELESDNQGKTAVEAFLTLLEEWHGCDAAPVESTENAQPAPPRSEAVRST